MSHAYVFLPVSSQPPGRAFILMAWFTTREPGDQRSVRILHDAGGSQSATLADALSFSELSCGFRVETTSHANFPSLSLAVSRYCLGAAQRADPTLRQCFSNVASADKELRRYHIHYSNSLLTHIRKRANRSGWHLQQVCLCLQSLTFPVVDETFNVLIVSKRFLFFFFSFTRLLLRIKASVFAPLTTDRYVIFFSHSNSEPKARRGEKTSALSLNNWRPALHLGAFFTTGASLLDAPGYHSALRPSSPVLHHAARQMAAKTR